MALLASTLFAGVLGAFLQPDVYADFIAGSGNAVIETVKAVWLAMANGFSIDTGIADVDRLLSRGGMDSMLYTIWLILGAVTFGALLEEFGLIRRLIDPMIAAATSTGRLFLTVFACAFGLNLVAGEAYEDVSPSTRRKETIFAGIATAYTMFLFDAAGLQFLLLSTVILAPATLLYVKARSEHERRLFSPTEVVLCAVIVVGGIIGAVGLWTGRITI